jgi:hypothetical protein
MFADFQARNIPVIPLRDGFPKVEWSRYFEVAPSHDDARKWDAAGYNEYALLCGKVAGIIGLDIDIEDSARIYQLAGETPVRKRGSKGFTAFYRYNGEKSQSWKKPADSAPIVELLSDKRLTTIPPSPHRATGKPYVWLDGVGLLDCPELPMLSPDFITLMNALYPRPVRVEKPGDTAGHLREDLPLDDAAAALHYVSSDCSREDWLVIGMALRDEYGDAANELWHQWSAQAGTRYNRRDAQAVWRSFHGDGVTIGTLIHRAKQGGWLRAEKPTALSTSEYDISLDYGVIGKAVQRELKKEGAETLRVHGLVGEIADWITDTAVFPQPMLSLAAALSFVGMLKGHRIRGYTNLRTNLLCLSLAASAGGKEHPQNCLHRLAKVSGLDGFMMGEPTSGTGFLRSLSDRGGVALLVLDEIGRYLGNATHKQAGTHQREIIDYIIKSFSKASSVLKGREYADNKKNPTIDIENPHFCCIGSTVVEKMRDACGSTDVVDGFLNRWVLLVGEKNVKRRQKVKFSPPPASLLDKIAAFAPREYDPYGNEPNTKECRFTPAAWEYFCKFRDEMDSKKESTPYPLSALYGRVPEHAEKVALTLASGNFIEMIDVQAAIKIVNYSTACAMDFANVVADTDDERDYIRIRDVIAEHSPIKRNHLTRLTQFVRGGNRRRNEILENLLDCGIITMETIATASGGRETQVFHFIPEQTSK